MFGDQTKFHVGTASSGSRQKRAGDCEGRESLMDVASHFVFGAVDDALRLCEHEAHRSPLADPINSSQSTQSLVDPGIPPIVLELSLFGTSHAVL